jgi:hypothetical protein
VGPTHGVQATANAAPARSPATTGALEQALDVPLAVQLCDERRQDEEGPKRDDQRAGDLVEQLTAGSLALAPIIA